jgi:cytochrome c553
MTRSIFIKAQIARVRTRTNARSVFLAVLAVAASPICAEYGSDAAAQTVTVKPSDEFRAVFSTAVDVADGKRLAEASCASCHSQNGISTSQGVPHLAGQRAAYLYLELKAYQSGARTGTAMNNAVRFLSNDALVKAAAYYASLDPASPAATPAPAKPDPVDAGKAAAVACGGCHGEFGISNTPGMSSLVGLDPKYLVAAMKAYKSGQRKNELMKALLAGVADADINNIALYYALQKPGRAQTPAPGNQAAGKTAAADCAGCHGDLGVSGTAATPSLAGQDAAYFAASMRAYKDGSRDDETMKALATPVDDDTIQNLAAFYASQEPQPPNVRKPLTTDEWAQRCDRCHGSNGNSTDPRLPALAGQRVEYLEGVLQAYRTRARKSPEMAAMSDALTDYEVENLAAHYARQKPRAVMYVTMPSR